MKWYLPCCVVAVACGALPPMSGCSTDGTPVGRPDGVDASEGGSSNTPLDAGPSSSADAGDIADAGDAGDIADAADADDSAAADDAGADGDGDAGDGGVDAEGCVLLTAGPFTHFGTEGNFLAIFVTTSSSPKVTGPGETLRLELWGAEPGTFDLAMEPWLEGKVQLMLESAPENPEFSFFFQVSGTLEIQEFSAPEGKVRARATNVKLVEQTLDPETIMYVPKPGGRCARLLDESISVAN